MDTKEKKEIKKRFERYNFLYIDKLKKESVLRNPKQVYFMYFENDFNLNDFSEPFFNKEQVINLNDGNFKFLTYCGKDQNKNISKNALILEKLHKNIYRVYLMESDLNLRDLFLEFSPKKTIKENNYSLYVGDYVSNIKDTYTKKEVIYIINSIVNKLCDLSKQ